MYIVKYKYNLFYLLTIGLLYPIFYNKRLIEFVEWCCFFASSIGQEAIDVF